MSIIVVKADNIAEAALILKNNKISYREEDSLGSALIKDLITENIENYNTQNEDYQVELRECMEYLGDKVEEIIETECLWYAIYDRCWEEAENIIETVKEKMNKL